jgi:hypothetical protein
LARVQVKQSVFQSSGMKSMLTQLATLEKVDDVRRQKSDYHRAVMTNASAYLDCHFVKMYCDGNLET